jgi:carboxyl-terminal processing protease
MKLKALPQNRFVPLLLAGLAGLVAGIAATLVTEHALDVRQPTPRSTSSRALDATVFNEALGIVLTEYYEPNLDYGRLGEGSVRGMVEGLGDPYSFYLAPEQYQGLKRRDSGLYSGIGIDLNAGAGSDPPVVSRVVPGSPAEQARIATGDSLLSIDGTSTSNLTADQVSVALQGPTGTSVQLGLEREGRALHVKLTRSSITVPSVRSADLDGGIFYVRIYEFDASTGSDFDVRLEQGLPTARRLVLDLRDNSGGSIEGAVSVISQFVPSGVALQLRERSKPPVPIRVSGTATAALIPLVVLVNANTASSAEMVAGSLAAHGRAKLVGAATAGKDSVQRDFPLADGADIHLTVKRWLLPDGHSVKGAGLKPDVDVPLASPSAVYDVEHPSVGHALDPQLGQALALLDDS